MTRESMATITFNDELVDILSKSIKTGDICCKKDAKPEDKLICNIVRLLSKAKDDQKANILLWGSDNDIRGIMLDDEVVGPVGAALDGKITGFFRDGGVLVDRGDGDEMGCQIFSIDRVCKK